MNAFISYTVRDGLIDAPMLRRLAKRFECVVNPFIDLLHHPEGGSQQRVWHALEDADIFILCITPKTFESPWVTSELRVAMARGIPIIAAQFD